MSETPDGQNFKILFETGTLDGRFFYKIEFLIPILSRKIDAS